MPEVADPFVGLYRMAVFSAALRGHGLGEWHRGQGFARASCILCGAEVRVYFPALQPEMDGPAIEQECTRNAVAGKAA